MTLQHRLATLTFVALIAALPAAADDAVRILHSERLQQLSLERTPTAAALPGDADSPLRLQFDALGRRFDLALEPNRRLTGGLDRAAFTGGVQVYRGALTASPGSWARIVIADGQPTGLVYDGSELIAIEADATGAIAFRVDDLVIEPGAMSCAAGSAQTGGDLLTALKRDAAVAKAQGPGATSQIDIAVVADFEFASDKGSETQAQLLARMNNIDGIFSEQLGVQFNVGRFDIFADAADPFSDETDAGNLLDELAQFRSDRPEQRSNGLTHLFTGRNLDGSTVGIAFLGALCRTSAGSGLTQATSSVTTDSLIAAHEFGHNFGAPHDGTEGSVCESTPQDFLMAPRVNGSDTFSDCSIEQMEDDVARASCITALPSTDVAVNGNPPGAVLLGNSTDVSFDVDSIGTDTASGVQLAVVVPGAVSLDSVSASAGSCSSGAGTVDCTLGAIGSGSGVTVTLSVTADAVGTAAFVATTTATVDANANNNAETLNLAVDPAVELLAITPAQAQIQVDQSVTVRPTIENRATIAASNVEVGIQPAAGLRIESVSWSAGSCNATAGSATCSATSLAAQATTTLELRLTGTSSGTHSYSVDVTSDDTDRQPGNNEATGQVSVGTTTVTEDDSGGGTTGLLTLLGLAALLRARKIKPV